MARRFIAALTRLSLVVALSILGEASCFSLHAALDARARQYDPRCVRAPFSRSAGLRVCIPELSLLQIKKFVQGVGAQDTVAQTLSMILTCTLSLSPSTPLSLFHCLVQQELAI